MGVMQVMSSLLMAQPHKESVTGTDGIATFDTDFKAPAKVVIPFSPVQEGEGDPSPENVRPITGWTGCDIWHTGKNLFDKNAIPYMSGEYISGISGTSISTTSNRAYNIYKLSVKPGVDYTIGPIKANDSYWAFVDADENVLSSGKNNGGRVGKTFTLTAPENADGILLSVGINDNIYYRCDDILQVETGSTATAYEDYHGTTLPITFTDPSTGDPMTVYGGTLTLNEDGSADLVKTWSIADLGALSWSWSSSGSCFESRYIYGSPLNSEDVLTIVCDCYKAMPNVTYPPADKTIIFNKASGDTRSYFRVKDANYGTDTAAFKAAMSGHYAAYRLRTAGYTTYHFNNIGQLKSFIGQNNVWTDLNGDPTVTFWKHG